MLKSNHVDEPPALGFSFNFTMGLGFDLKKGLEMVFDTPLQDAEVIQSRSPSLRSSGRNRRLWDNPLPEAKNPG
jgi:hypothetical protein